VSGSASLSAPDGRPAPRRAFRCHCGRPVFFRNSRCLACGTPLGYVPSAHDLRPLQAGPEAGTWVLKTDGAGGGPAYRRCANFDSPAACNWLVEPHDPAGVPALCAACRLNRTIPDLSHAPNLALWLQMERAKRRLVSQLIGLGLPVRARVDDPQRGLAFDILSTLPGQPRVLTGYHDGIITINLEEADDAVRERTRVDMHEPYRTLLGHFRHEVGHYYWRRLIAGTPQETDGRRLFGDERQDYAAALNTHYERGPPSDWARRFVSAYASIHPSEDWAESWAHYLHVRDTLDTAARFGIAAAPMDSDTAAFSPADLWRPDAPDATDFLDMLHRWIFVTGVMNEMSRAMGQHDFYPFVLPRSAVAKLHFIHGAISDVAANDRSTP
jgi:hypothetical protein